MLHIPLLTHPLGWLVLGIGGLALYRTGKKQAQREAAVSHAAPETEANTTGKGKEEN